MKIKFKLDTNSYNIAYIVYRVSKHSDLRIDQNSYTHFFFYEEETLQKLKELVDTNKYSEIYNIYSRKDYWVKVNYRLLKTGIPKVDAYIAKETVNSISYML